LASKTMEEGQPLLPDGAASPTSSTPAGGAGTPCRFSLPELRAATRDYLGFSVAYVHEEAPAATPPCASRQPRHGLRGRWVPHGGAVARRMPADAARTSSPPARRSAPPGRRPRGGVSCW
jgi:hypothetical protein